MFSSAPLKLVGPPHYCATSTSSVSWRGCLRSQGACGGPVDLLYLDVHHVAASVRSTRAVHHPNDVALIHLDLEQRVELGQCLDQLAHPHRFHNDWHPRLLHRGAREHRIAVTGLHYCSTEPRAGIGADERALLPMPVCPGTAPRWEAATRANGVSRILLRPALSRKNCPGIMPDHAQPARACSLGVFVHQKVVGFATARVSAMNPC